MNRFAVSENRAENRKKSVEIYERCHEYAIKKHAGQLRKDGTPYITHPEAVAEQFNYGDKAKTVAILHDVLEDTDATEEEIRLLGCDDEIVDAFNNSEDKPRRLTVVDCSARSFGRLKSPCFGCKTEHGCREC